MPFAVSEGVRIYYRVEGNADRPALALVHSLGADHGLWDPQMPALLRHFRALRVDVRGHGASDAPAGDYSIEMLARDVLAAADAAGLREFAYCGLSLGGMIGLWIGAHSSERVTALVLANTSARAPDPAIFGARRRTVIERGMAAVADAAMERCFSERMRASKHPAVASSRSTLLGTDAVGYAGCCAAIRDTDQRDLMAQVRARTLVIGGNQDISMPWSGHGEALAVGISGARAVVLDAAHLSNLERSASFTSALLDFLIAKPEDTLAAGFAMRRAVLGDAYVDGALAGTTDLTREFQELITRYAWGGVWSRPGLDPRYRRMLAMAIAASLGRWEEFRLHVRTGLTGELELSDLKETLLQVAIYAGVPAANSAFRMAQEELAAPGVSLPR